MKKQNKTGGSRGLWSYLLEEMISTFELWQLLNSHSSSRVNTLPCPPKECWPKHNSSMWCIMKLLYLVFICEKQNLVTLTYIRIISEKKKRSVSYMDKAPRKTWELSYILIMENTVNCNILQVLWMCPLIKVWQETSMVFK